ncbi:CMGC/MAPK protein kinase [Cryptosporidium canis]|uniref:CMGC/MAPK protein kinase n=1 Tax=Cryptosporidium canis TaxID=195482 RepID=A0ABQ8P4G8_9CRYT|nr:CMGC/MAPK protein kinase [Cryptosporidium canis]
MDHGVDLGQPGSLGGKGCEKRSHLDQEYSVISKDNDAYLLLFKMMDHDKQRMLMLLGGDGYSSSVQPKEGKDAELGVIIKKYSPRSWTKVDVHRLKELSALKKGVFERKPGAAQIKKLRDLEYRTESTPNSVLRIDYTNRLLLEGGPDLSLLPNIEHENLTSSELTLYTERSLIRASDRIVGLGYRGTSSLARSPEIQEEHLSAYPDDHIKGLIRYFKFNKGSYGEVWRGLAFTEYLSEPFGNCGSEGLLGKDHLNWRRGELLNHELNSLIIDVLNMLQNDFRRSQRSSEDHTAPQSSEQDSEVLDVVMKKMSHDLDESRMLYSVVREVFFGIVLYCSPHVSRFLHIFEESVEDQKDTSQSSVKSNIWLVYRYEGVSLGNLLFEIGENGSLVPSAFWWKRVKSKGEGVFREILHQILLGISSAHRIGIIHRDIKPSNIFIAQEKDPSGQDRLYVRVGDWGSAMITEESRINEDTFVGDNHREMEEALYGKTGPTSEDETEGFQPPEVQFRSFGSESSERELRRLSYDIWSVGIVMLQMTWGNLQVFSVLNEDSEFQHLLKRAMFHIKHIISEENQTELTQEELINDSVYRLSLMRLCLLDMEEGNNGYSSKLDAFISQVIERSIKKSMKNSSHEVVGITKRCSYEDLRDLIRKHDPSGVGLESREALDLLKRLLKPRHKERISIREALEHSYFS